MKFLNRIIQRIVNQWIRLWFHLWFQEKNTVPLDVIRIGIGFLLCFNYGLLSSTDVVAFYGDSGLFSRAVVPEINQLVSFSFFTFFDQPWQLLTFHYVFVALCFCLMIGWQTRWVKWLVLLGHLTYFNRNEYLYYGVDTVAIALLLILCVAPVGSALSLDRIRQVRKYKDRYGLDARPPLLKSMRGFACQRLMQLQMAVIFFFAGVEKLAGNLWLTGEAPWYAFNNYAVAFMPTGFFAEHFWLVKLIGFGTLIIETAYPFLIWASKTRPYVLIAALTLHAGIAVFMGMYFFAALMICGHIAFMRRSWYEAAGRWWREQMGSMEMIYDGNCGFCKKSMALFLSFDGLQQITTRNYHDDPSPVVSDEDADKAIYTVTANRQTLPGFEAYRYVVARTPGMWWFAPLFYIPVLSRMLGRLAYQWIASHRMQLSGYFFKPDNKSSCASDTAAHEHRTIK